MIGRNSLALAGVAMAALAGAWPVRAQQIDYSGSVQYASGDYLFPERSSALFLYNGLGVTAGRMRFSASVPLVFQRTPWVIYTDVTGDSGADGGSTAGQDVTGSGGEVGYTAVDTISYEELGLGDPLVRADLRLLDDSGLWPSVRVTFDVKVPVGDVERGFSSGEWDYAGGVSVTKSVGTTLVFVDLAYWYIGDMPGVELENSVAYGAGIGQSIGAGKLGLWASIFGNSRIQPAVDPPVQVSLGLSYLLDLRRSLMISASAGLTDSAPDISLSFGWFIRF
jgi:hypothetical protein